MLTITGSEALLLGGMILVFAAYLALTAHRNR